MPMTLNFQEQHVVERKFVI